MVETLLSYIESRIADWRKPEPTEKTAIVQALLIGELIEVKAKLQEVIAQIKDQSKFMSYYEDIDAPEFLMVDLDDVLSLLGGVEQ